jgi:hypothetical protein
VGAKEYQKLVDNGKQMHMRRNGRELLQIFLTDKAKQDKSSIAAKNKMQKHIRYAQMLKASGQIQEANKQMQELFICLNT